jgi:DNA-binding CsgD family transcriptional regulator
MHDLRCPEHPDGRVRRCRTNGPRGRGIYPECVPADGSARHALTWEDAASTVSSVVTEVRLAPQLGATRLTPNELIVLCEAANGYTAAESAKRLGKGTPTVKTQRGQILLKLHAANTAQAVCIATEQGILVVDRGSANATPARPGPRPRDVRPAPELVRG